MAMTEPGPDPPSCRGPSSSSPRSPATRPRSTTSLGRSSAGAGPRPGLLATVATLNRCRAARVGRGARRAPALMLRHGARLGPPALARPARGRRVPAGADLARPHLSCSRPVEARADAERRVHGQARRAATGARSRASAARQAGPTPGADGDAWSPTPAGTCSQAACPGVHRSQRSTPTGAPTLAASCHCRRRPDGVTATAPDAGPMPVEHVVDTASRESTSELHVDEPRRHPPRDAGRDSDRSPPPPATCPLQASATGLGRRTTAPRPRDGARRTCEPAELCRGAPTPSARDGGLDRGRRRPGACSSAPTGGG